MKPEITNAMMISHLKAGVRREDEDGDGVAGGGAVFVVDAFRVRVES